MDHTEATDLVTLDSLVLQRAQITSWLLCLDFERKKTAPLNGATSSGSQHHQIKNQSTTSLRSVESLSSFMSLFTSLLSSPLALPSNLWVTLKVQHGEKC